MVALARKILSKFVLAHHYSRQASRKLHNGLTPGQPCLLICLSIQAALCELLLIDGNSLARVHVIGVYFSLPLDLQRTGVA